MRTDNRQGGVTSPRRAVVIGSGFGGLAAAIRLQAAGVPTLVLEALSELGGRAGVFSEQGFVFDRGPTVVTAPACLEELFALGGKVMADYVELLPVSPMYRLLWGDGSHFDYVAAEAALKAEIARLSPGDVGRYDDFYRYTCQVLAKGYTELGHVPFLNFTDMVKVAPDLVRLRAHLPVYNTVAKYFKDERLRQAFSFSSLLIGGNPMRASSIYSLIHPLERQWGVYFPRGGTHALIRAMAKLLVDLGGEVRLDAPVDQIATRTVSGRVQVTGVRVAGTGGGLEECDAVVSNADVVHTYGRLLAHEPKASRRAAALAKKRPSISLFVVYFGTRRAYPDLLHHTVVFGPRYGGLLGDLFDRGVVAGDMSLYVHAPTLTDPSLAPAGCHTYYALAPVPHLGHRQPYDWANQAEAYADQVIATLEKRAMPGLSKDIVVRRVFTPLDFRDRLGAYQGAAFSLEPTLTQSAYFRVHNRDPDISGLYFVGAGTHPGAGIPGVVGSAKATAGLVLQGPNPAAAAAIGAEAERTAARLWQPVGAWS